MEWIDSLFFEHSAIQAIVVLSLVTAAGLWLGKMHVWGISLGVTFVFFVGILAGHLGISLDADMLNYAESFGLVLFVYALGLQVGPGFFSSLRHGGVKLNLLSLGVIFIGTAMTVLLSYGLSIPLPDMVGVLCGATTNTPALGAAQQTLKQMGEPSSSAALGAAVAYPLGVVGVILAILVIRKILARPADMEEKETEDHNQGTGFIQPYEIRHLPPVERRKGNYPDRQHGVVGKRPDSGGNYGKRYAYPDPAVRRTGKPGLESGRYRLEQHRP